MAACGLEQAGRVRTCVQVLSEVSPLCNTRNTNMLLLSSTLADMIYDLSEQQQQNWFSLLQSLSCVEVMSDVCLQVVLKIVEHTTQSLDLVTAADYSSLLLSMIEFISVTGTDLIRNIVMVSAGCLLNTVSTVFCPDQHQLQVMDNCLSIINKLQRQENESLQHVLSTQVVQYFKTTGQPSVLNKLYLNYFDTASDIQTHKHVGSVAERGELFTIIPSLTSRGWSTLCQSEHIQTCAAVIVEGLDLFEDDNDQRSFYSVIRQLCSQYKQTNWSDLIQLIRYEV